MEDRIDFVVPWVDGNDPKWIEEKNKYSDNQAGDSRDIRFREFGLLRYWFRAVEKNAPWVNRIYLVTWGHLPEWLNKDHEKIVIVNHNDYIPKQYLPTFSSHVIELNLHRITELSEHFVYFNDDVYILKKTLPQDFFVDGLPCDCLIENPIAPIFGGFSPILCETTSVINKHFTKDEVKSLGFNKYFSIAYRELNFRTLFMSGFSNIMGFYNPHISQPHLKSTFQKVWDVEFDELNRTCINRFRGINEVNQYLFRYWNLCSGNFHPTYPIGKNIKLSERIELITDIIVNKKYKVVTINDVAGLSDIEERQLRIKRAFDCLFPEKCSFEK